MQTAIPSYARRNRIAHAVQSSLGKRWRLYILPHHHANLPQPITYEESYILAKFVAELTRSAKLEDVATFLLCFKGLGHAILGNFV